MQVVIEHKVKDDGTGESVVHVEVKDGAGSTMEAGSGHNGKAAVALGERLFIETTDHSGGEPDLDDIFAEPIA